MTDQQQPTPGGTATPDEKQKAAEAESYGGVPMDDQEMADVWTGPEQVGSAPQPGASGQSDVTDQEVDREREAEESAAGEPPD
jgi:hypothetical protein